MGHGERGGEGGLGREKEKNVVLGKVVEKGKR